MWKRFANDDASEKDPKGYATLALGGFSWNERGTANFSHELRTITRVQGPHLGILLQSNCILFKGPFSGSCYLVFVASESAFVQGPCLGILLFFVSKNILRNALEPCITN